MAIMKVDAFQQLIYKECLSIKCLLGLSYIYAKILSYSCMAFIVNTKRVKFTIDIMICRHLQFSPSIVQKSLSEI